MVKGKDYVGVSAMIECHNVGGDFLSAPLHFGAAETIDLLKKYY